MRLLIFDYPRCLPRMKICRIGTGLLLKVPLRRGGRAGDLSWEDTPRLFSPSPFLHGVAEAEEAFKVEPVPGHDPCRAVGAFEGTLAVRASPGRKGPDILHREEDLFPGDIGHACLTSVFLQRWGECPVFWS